MSKSILSVVAMLGLAAAIVAGWDLNAETLIARPELKVYKAATCGCCGDWISHMERIGFAVDTSDVVDLAAIKKQYGIRSRLQSCHTAVSKEGFIFEGHVPGKVIKAFLSNPVDGSIGLTVPGMPMGSPGMEMGRFVPYDVLLVRKDGSTAVYQHIDSPDYE